MAFSAGEGSAVNIKAVDAAVGIVDVQDVSERTRCSEIIEVMPGVSPQAAERQYWLPGVCMGIFKAYIKSACIVF